MALCCVMATLGEMVYYFSLPTAPVAMTYGADMRLLVNVGDTPTVLFGPGDVRASHRPDEHVPVEELVAAVRTLALTALRFCGHET